MALLWEVHVDANVQTYLVNSVPYKCHPLQRLSVWCRSSLQFITVKMATLKHISDALVNFLCSSRFSLAGWISLVGKLVWRFFFHLGKPLWQHLGKHSLAAGVWNCQWRCLREQHFLTGKTEFENSEWQMFLDFFFFYSCFESLLNFSSRMFMQVVRQYLALALFLL